MEYAPTFARVAPARIGFFSFFGARGVTPPESASSPTLRSPDGVTDGGQKK